jgi:hypothetical protein
MFYVRLDGGYESKNDKHIPFFFFYSDFERSFLSSKMSKNYNCVCRGSRGAWTTLLH